MFRQMEKLIELLNEYENRDLELEEGEESNARTENNGHLWFNGANKVQFDTYMFDSLALSKQYGFIKWLVENEKIKSEGIKPRADLVREVSIIDRETNKPIGWENQYSEWEQLIMYLSIQDEPLDFLVSILK